MTFRPLGVLLVALAAFLGGFAAGSGKLPHVAVPHVGPVTPPAVPEKATAATYVYEKDRGEVPPAVLSGLNRLNRERHITATALEADPQNGTGDVPESCKVPLAAAKEAGLPALVVTAGGKVLAVVKNPKDEQAVLEAVK